MLEFVLALLVWLYLQGVMATATVMMYKDEDDVDLLTFWYRAFTYPALLIIKVLRPWKR